MRLVLSASLVLLFAIPAAADYKMVIRTTYGKHSLTETRLVRGERQRVEGDRRYTHLYQCDKKRLASLNPETRLYSLLPIGEDGNPQLRNPRVASQSPTLYHYTVTTEETNERATIFGYPAWRVRDTITNETQGTRTIADTWYIDLPLQWGCRTPSLPPPLDWTFPEVKISQQGSARRGFPVLTRRLHGSGRQQQEVVTQVLELSPAQLDSALFEIPSDYGQGLDGSLTIPDTFAARTRKAWDEMWVNAARFFFEK